MSNLNYLFVAFLITWLVISAYLWMLGRQVQNLKDEVETLTEGTELNPERYAGSPRPESDAKALGQR